MEQTIKDLNLSLLNNKFGLHNQAIRVIKFNTTEDLLRALIANGKALNLVKNKLEKSSKTVRELVEYIGVEDTIKLYMDDDEKSEGYWDIIANVHDYVAYRLLSEENSYIKEKYTEKLEFNTTKDNKYTSVNIYELNVDLKDIALDTLTTDEIQTYLSNKDYRILEKAYEKYIQFIMKLEY